MVNGRKIFIGYFECFVFGDDVFSEVIGESLVGIEVEKWRGKSSKKKKKMNNKKKENKKEKNFSSYYSIIIINMFRIDVLGSVEGGFVVSDGVWLLLMVLIIY